MNVDSVYRKCFALPPTHTDVYSPEDGSPTETSPTQITKSCLLDSAVHHKPCLLV